MGYLGHLANFRRPQVPPQSFMKTIFFVALALNLLSASTGASAETRYTCRTDSGYYQSSEPCSGTNNGMVYYGPSTEQPRYVAPPPKVGQAPDHLLYLTPRCAALNDAIRTAAARGLNNDTSNQLRAEYNRECAENERDARSRVSMERREQRKQLEGAQAQAKQQQERTALEQQQCGEFKRVLYAKRTRTDLTDGEKSDLKRVEENYHKRCS
jgi:hypothetical protein